jgi:hypothetical protein
VNERSAGLDHALGNTDQPLSRGLLSVQTSVRTSVSLQPVIWAPVLNYNDLRLQYKRRREQLGRLKTQRNRTVLYCTVSLQIKSYKKENCDL